MRGMARPSSYTEAVATEICTRLANGESLTKICKDPKMPSSPTVQLWLDQNPPFLAWYARARERQADFFAGQIVEIADNSKLLADDRRVRIDARKWVAGKMRPKVYGERQTLAHEGQVSVTISSTDAEL
jgi:hypothetical protein